MRTRNRKGEGAQLREDLVDAADTLLVAAGDESAVSLRAVARQAGVSAPSVYLHFDGKQDLVGAVVDRRFRQLEAHIRAATADVADPVTGFRAGVHAYCDWAEREPGGYRLLFGTSVGTRSQDDPQAGADAFATLVEGLEGLGAQDPPRLAALVWAGLHGLLTLRQARPGFPWPPLDQQVEDLLERLVGIPPAAAGQA